MNRTSFHFFFSSAIRTGLSELFPRTAQVEENPTKSSRLKIALSSSSLASQSSCDESICCSLSFLSLLFDRQPATSCQWVPSFIADPISLSSCTPRPKRISTTQFPASRYLESISHSSKHQAQRFTFARNNRRFTTREWL